MSQQECNTPCNIQVTPKDSSMHIKSTLHLNRQDKAWHNIRDSYTAWSLLTRTLHLKHRNSTLHEVKKRKQILNPSL